MATRPPSLPRLLAGALAEPRTTESDRHLLERFAETGDEAAFSALVERHGPMLVALCRRLVSDADLADDVLQATFVVLAKKARSIRRRESLASWLYGVAQRLARQARLAEVARSRRERRVAQERAEAAQADPGWHELLRILDEEVQRLPERYRSPLLLCYLDGRTQDEAAKQLGWSLSTLRRRLNTGRERLRARMTRQGATLGAGLFAAFLVPTAARGALTAELQRAIVKTGIAASKGISIPASIAVLAKGGMGMTAVAKMSVCAIVALALSGVFAAVLHREPPAREREVPVVARLSAAGPQSLTARGGKRSLGDAEPSSGAVQPPQAAAEQGRLAGRFTDADTHQSVAGARIRVLTDGVPGKPKFAEAVSDADGRYVVKLPLGHGFVFGVYAPAGYFTQDPKTYGAILTTPAEPQLVRDFVLQRGAPWKVEVHGVALAADNVPHFSAAPDVKSDVVPSGTIIMVTSNAQGEGVLAIPTAGGPYRYSCGLMESPSRHEIPSANLQIDKDFDPQQIKGVPERLPGGKTVRLRDTAGRSATVEGAEVLVRAGQAVLRFHAQAIPTGSGFMLRGRAFDEAGKPIDGATFTAAFTSARGGAMSRLQATTDAQGKFELRDVRLPQSYFAPEKHISMMVVKAGFDGAQTKELNLLEVKQNGVGDFGTVTLKTGRTLRGKVVDENGRPLHGALVTNRTNYFLYGHLRCRTDAEGRFAMPDLSFGTQKIEAQHGERSGQEEFSFDATSGECVITARLTPKSGMRPGPGATARQVTVPPARPADRDGAWDLTPPAKEPKYQK
jgi:RNA polymerase sigma factor (sigma-70 family)